MNIIDKLQLKERYVRHNNEFKSIQSNFKQEKLDYIGSNRNGLMQYEYSLSLELMAVFTANSVQLNEAVRAAKTNLSSSLYSEVIAMLTEVNTLIYSGKASQASILIGEIIDSMRFQDAR